MPKPQRASCSGRGLLNLERLGDGTPQVLPEFGAVDVDASIADRSREPVVQPIDRLAGARRAEQCRQPLALGRVEGRAEVELAADHGEHVDGDPALEPPVRGQHGQDVALEELADGLGPLARPTPPWGLIRAPT